jgi:hypothetical protein
MFLPYKGMKFEPHFYQNWKDNNHCLQASVMMVLNTLSIPVGWEDVNNMTQYEDDLYSWDSIVAVELAKYIPGVKLISELDYREFIQSGIGYLKGYWDISWFEIQQKKSSTGFKKEQDSAKILLNENLFECRNINKTDIEKFLEKNLLIALVDSHKLQNKQGVAGHFVVMYGQDDNNFVLHDPGLPPKKGWVVEKDSFMEAFKGSIIIIPKGKLKFGIETNRNDPCPCGSGKKYKKCHGK